MAVYPINDLNLVEKLGERLKVDMDALFTLDNVDGKLLILC